MSWFAEDTDVDDPVAEQLQRDLRAAWGKLLNDEAGRLVVWSILEKCHLYHTTYTGNADTNFREGERSVGLKILQEHIFPLGPEYLLKMQIEFQERVERIGIALDQGVDSDGRDDS